MTDADQPVVTVAEEDDGPPPLRAGEFLAPSYRVVGHLRRGRDLDVYDLWSEERTARCVGKTVRPDRVEDQTVRRRLLREGRLLARLTHPHIVRAYETVSQPQPIVVLETLPGETLAHLNRRPAPPPADRRDRPPRPSPLLGDAVPPPAWRPAPGPKAVQHRRQPWHR